MISRRRQLILIGITLFVVLLTLYFVVILPFVNKKEENNKVPLELVDDIEQEGPNGRYLLFEKVERSSMSSIKVTNEYGTFEVVRNGNSLVIKDYETTNINPTILSYLVSSSGYTLANTKICDHATNEQFAQYGLDNPIAAWTVTTTYGKVYSVEVGNPTVSEDGYYCRFVGRDSIYVLDSMLSISILQPVEKLISTTLLGTIPSTTYYMISDFKFYKDGEVYLSTKVTNNSIENREVELTYPVGYNIGSEYDENLSYFAQLTGSEVVKLGIDSETLEKYGLKDPAYKFSFKYDGISYTILVSEKQEDGTYFINTSEASDVIMKINSSALPFLEKGLISWISPHFYWEYLVQVDTITITSKDFSETFDVISTYHEDTELYDVEVSTSSGKYYDKEASINFRRFCQYLVSVQFMGETELTKSEINTLISSNEPYLTFSYTKLNGKTYTFDFYQYSTRKSLLVIGGEGQFYVYTDVLDNIVENAKRVINDEMVDPHIK